MENVKNKLVCGAAGIAGGLSGVVSLPHCTGSACASCFGCAGAGMGILLLLLLRKMKRGNPQERREG